MLGRRFRRRLIGLRGRHPESGRLGRAGVRDLDRCGGRRRLGRHGRVGRNREPARLRRGLFGRAAGGREREADRLAGILDRGHAEQGGDAGLAGAGAGEGGPLLKPGRKLGGRHVLRGDRAGAAPVAGHGIGERESSGGCGRFAPGARAASSRCAMPGRRGRQGRRRGRDRRPARGLSSSPTAGGGAGIALRDLEQGDAERGAQIARIELEHVAISGAGRSEAALLQIDVGEQLAIADVARRQGDRLLHRGQARAAGPAERLGSLDARHCRPGDRRTRRAPAGRGIAADGALKLIMVIDSDGG